MQEEEGTLLTFWPCCQTFHSAQLLPWYSTAPHLTRAPISQESSPSPSCDLTSAPASLRTALTASRRARTMRSHLFEKAKTHYELKWSVLDCRVTQTVLLMRTRFNNTVISAENYFFDLVWEKNSITRTWCWTLDFYWQSGKCFRFSWKILEISTSASLLALFVSSVTILNIFSLWRAASILHWFVSWTTLLFTAFAHL